MPNPSLEEKRPALEITGRSPQHTRAFGARLGRLLPPGMVIALIGDLGSGKTTLTQGIAAGLEIAQAVTSPTFTFVNEYPVTDNANGVTRLVHIDLYRLPDATGDALAEAETFGLEELLDVAGDASGAAPDSVVIVEWAERIGPVLPADHLRIELRYGSSEPNPASAADATAVRLLRLTAGGPRAQAIVERLADA